MPRVNKIAFLIHCGFCNVRSARSYNNDEEIKIYQSSLCHESKIMPSVQNLPTYSSADNPNKNLEHHDSWVTFFVI